MILKLYLNFIIIIMKSKVFKLFYILFLSVFLTNCTSVEKYNKKIAQPISVKKIKKDVDYVQRKLLKLHPNLYAYISKEQLNFKFDSLRNTIQVPLTSKEFYFAISPVIASVRQGHMSMSPVSKRYTNKELKRLLKAGTGPLSQFVFQWENDKLYVLKNNSKEKYITTGTEIITVNGISPQQLHEKYKSGITSDGLNTTFLRKWFSKRYISYMTNEIGVNDSLTFVFKQKDSVFTKVICRKKAEKNVKKDSVRTHHNKDIVANPDKEKLKVLKRNKKILGYDAVSKEYSKSLKFVSNDSLVAVLKIKNFSKGWYNEAYEMLFDSIKKQKAHTLIIDIRDNPGGKVADVVNLYSYLTNKNYTLLKPAVVTSKTSLWKLGMFEKIPKLAYPFGAVFYPFYMGFTTLRTKKQNGIYTYGLVGSRERKFNKNHFDGKIYVIINGGSFSAACLLSSALKENPKVTFVGEETGGGFNGTVAGIMPVLQLPHSKIPWRLGLMQIETVHETPVYGRGIFPDKEIIQTIEDKVNNNDPEMEWILKDIEKR